MPKSLPRLAGVPCFLFQGQRCAGQPVQHNDRGVQQDKPSKQPMQRRLQPNGTHISRLFNSFRFHLLVSFCGVFKKVKRANTDTVITTVEVENRPNTYYLMLRDRSIYLTAVGTALKWSAYTGEEEQMFTILEPGTGSDGSDSGEVSNVPDSKLVTKFIPAYEGNYTKDRKAQGGTISEITIHHCASILTIDALGALWQREGRKGSSHYGVSETNIGQYVHESDVAWTNGNWEANCRAVTIETSNGGGAPEWPVSDTTFQTLVTLVADIARRNGLGKLVKGKNLTWHSMYAATACPGPYLSGKLQELVDKANTINGF